MAIRSDFAYIFKVLLIGDSGTGKSSVLKRFIDNEFEDEIATTVGVDFGTKVLTSHGTVSKVSIWDTAGQERFRSLTASYYRGCHGVILVFDVNSKVSFANIKDWLTEIELYASRQYLALLLVGNKIDLKKRQVSTQEAETLAKHEAMTYVETSALTCEGIAESFNVLFDRIMETPALLENATQPSHVSVVKSDEETSSCSAC